METITLYGSRIRAEQPRAVLVTPLLDVTPPGAAGYRIAAKIEAMNPGLSVKDRVARHLVTHAVAGWTAGYPPVLLEASSGNTAVSVAVAAAGAGLRALLFVPEGTSQVRIERMKAFGADVVTTPAEEGTGGARSRAAEAAARDGTLLYLDQHGNGRNIEAHMTSTGPELVSQLCGETPRTLVASLGTGGTVIGLTRALRTVNPDIFAVAAIPRADGEIQGMRRPSPVDVPLHGLLDADIDEVGPDEADWWRIRIGRTVGVPVGPSSGAAMAAAVRAGERRGGLVVTVFPDHGFNYL